MAAAAEEGGGRGCGGGGGVGGLGAPSHSRAHAHDASNRYTTRATRVRGPTPTTARKGRRQTEQNEGDAPGAAGATKVRK